MKEFWKRFRSGLVLAGVFAIVVAGLVVLSFSLAEDSQGGSLAVDPDMYTRRFFSKVDLGLDGSFRVTEDIGVHLNVSKHGIYRYVPVKGKVAALEGSQLYTMEFQDAAASAPLKVERRGGQMVFRMGSETELVRGDVDYTLSYTMVPTMQAQDYSLCYLNVLPLYWQNPHQEGSGFTIRFPKPVDPDAVRVYYGSYGSEEDATAVMDLTWEEEGKTLTGVLRSRLAFGQGVTLYVPLPQGYYEGLRSMGSFRDSLFWRGLVLLFLGGILFWILGKERVLTPPITFLPPEGLDSAGLGFLADGVTDKEDVVSLLINWADRGFLTFREAEGGEIYLRKTEKPFQGEDYEKLLFQRIFRMKEQVSLSSLTYRLADTVQVCRRKVTKSYGGWHIYTKGSLVVRGLLFLTALEELGEVWGFLRVNALLPALGYFGLLLGFLCAWMAMLAFGRLRRRRYTMDATAFRLWLSLGLLSVVVGIVLPWGTLAMAAAAGRAPSLGAGHVAFLLQVFGVILLASQSLRRSDSQLQRFEKIVGFRDFLEKAERERLEALAGENPQWFYRVLPYAYVLGVSDQFAKRLEGITLTPPEWYQGQWGSGGPYRRYRPVYITRSLHRSLDRMSYALVTPPAFEPSSTGGGSLRGGSGGFSGGGGGGFSGGGVGGGGGGSW